MFPERQPIVKVSHSATGWGTYFDTKLQKREFENTRDKLALALYRCLDELKRIVQQEVTAAASSTREYSNPVLLVPLQDAFADENLIKINFSNNKLYLNQEAAAGSLSDFWDGINYAREVIGTGGKSTVAQRSAYWRYFVYGKASAEGEDDKKGGDLYADTIALRMEAWGGLAPYWFWLEYGNNATKETTSELSGGIPFPTNSPRPFLESITQKINAVFARTLKEVEFQEENLVETALDRYSKNPDAYEPFDILEEFYENGRKYYSYITATRQFGVALPKTYRALRRESGL